MQLWRHPNGIFYVLYGPELKRRISTRTRERRAAELFFAQYIAGAADPLPSAPTVGAILRGYEADRAPRVRSKGALTYSTAALMPRLGDLLPDHLTPATIARYARDRGVKAGTVLREIGVLRAALAWAYERQWIPRVPVISNPVKAPPPRDRWITREEARRLLDGCVEPHVRLFIVLALTTAARMGAILDARWRQVDLDRGLIDYGVGHGNKRRALVPLNADATKALREAREIACTDFVIEFRGTAPVKNIRKGFQAACDRAELTGVTPHILRHSAATWMVMDGVPLAQVARVLGDSEATTERVYAKHAPGFLTKATNTLHL